MPDVRRILETADSVSFVCFPGAHNNKLSWNVSWFVGVAFYPKHWPTVLVAGQHKLMRAKALL